MPQKKIAARKAEEARNQAQKHAVARKQAAHPDLPPLAELRKWKKASAKTLDGLNYGDEVRAGTHVGTCIGRTKGKNPRIHAPYQASASTASSGASRSRASATPCRRSQFRPVCRGARASGRRLSARRA